MNDSQMQAEPWQESWQAIAAHLPTDGLKCLLDGLVNDSQDLIQGHISKSNREWSDTMENLDVAGGACAIGYCFFKTGHTTRSAILGQFAKTMTLARPSREGGCFLGWFDSTPRDEMRAKLAPEVQAELDRRNEQS